MVPGGVGYQDDYQVAGDDYPGMRMQPNDRIRSVAHRGEAEGFSGYSEIEIF